MVHNSVVSGHPKSIGIPWVDGFSTGPPDLGCHRCNFLKKIKINGVYKRKFW